MQCPVCQHEVGPQSAFCTNCGAAISAAPPPTPGYTAVPTTPPPPPAYPPPPQGYAGAPPAGASSGLSENSAAALAYLTIIPAIIFLVIEPYNKIPLVRFHSLQSIGLGVVYFVLWVALTVVQMVLHFLPGMFFLITMLFGFLHLALMLGMFILWLIAIIKASKGEWYKLPFIGDFAMKQVQS
jgi:uncharacterized membrane protein